jgi:hypothetical protein
MIDSRIPTDHKQISFTQGQVMRAPSPAFAPPVPASMREPGTNWFTIITANGPHTTESPGITQGKAATAAFNPAGASPQAPLTHKGG